MELPGAPPSHSQSQWPSSDICPARDPRRRLLRPQERLRLAIVATRLPALEDRLPLSFRSWRLDGTWERMHADLRERVRVRLNRNPQPSAAIVDSQGRSRPPEWVGTNVVTTE